MNKRFCVLLFPLVLTLSSHAYCAEADSNQSASQISIQPTAAKLQQANAKADNNNKQMKSRKKSKDEEAPSAIVIPQ